MGPLRTVDLRAGDVAAEPGGELSSQSRSAGLRIDPQSPLSLPPLPPVCFLLVVPLLGLQSPQSQTLRSKGDSWTRVLQLEVLDSCLSLVPATKTKS